MISKNFYTLRRSGHIRSFDAAKERIGKQPIENRTDDILQQLDMNWTNVIDKQSIRIYLKIYFSSHHFV